EALAADEAQAHLRILRLPLAHEREHLLEEVGVQAAGEAAIRRDDDDADRLRLALDEEGMPVVRIRVVEVRDDAANLLRVGPREPHALLSAAHLARGHHLHGLGDLLSVLHTRDLGADFLRAGHGWLSTCRSPGTA